MSRFRIRLRLMLAGVSLVCLPGAVVPRPVEAQQPVIATNALECERRASPYVSGTVTDRESEVGLGGATVTLHGDGEPASAVVVARTDPDGSYVFCGLRLGIDYEIRAEYGGTAGPIRRVRPSERPEDLLIDLGASAYLVVTLRDTQTEQPVLGATVRLDPLSVGGVSNAFGRVNLQDVPPGDYRIRVDHIGYRDFDGAISVTGGRATEVEVQLVPAVIDVEPLEVQITGRDPYLVNSGFYDRKATMDEAQFYTYWEVEPYAKFSTFMRYNREAFVGPRGWGQVFVNLRPIRRIGYRSVDEMPFGKIRGVERIPCRQAPREIQRYLRGASADCVVTLIWLGNRRVRADQSPPPGGPR